MKPLLARQTALACNAAFYCAIFTVMSMSGAAMAQTTGTVNLGTTDAEPSVKVDVPLGGCMPIGLTASGEMVFPILCKEFIQQHREKDMEQKPAVPEEKVTANPKETEALSEDVMSENSNSIDNAVKTFSLPKIVKHELRRRHMNQDGCQHYRTYDSASETYRSYDGRRRSCR
jgi:hypothetical protein